MIFFSRRDFLKLGSAAVLGSVLPRQLASAVSPSSEPFDKWVIYHGSRRLRTVAMTYDDCWHPEVLEQLMEMVRPYPTFHFTFFAIGDAIDIAEQVSPGLFKRLYEAGHEIGYHTYHHVDPLVTSVIEADFDQWMATLTRALGFSPRVHFARPPGNFFSPDFLQLCRDRGMVLTQYSAGLESPDMSESMRLASKVQNGDIVQMHTYQDPPHGRYDVDISAKAVPYLAEQGFTLVTMSQLYDSLLREQYSSDGCDVGSGASLTRSCLE